MATSRTPSAARSEAGRKAAATRKRNAAARATRTAARATETAQTDARTAAASVADAAEAETRVRAFQVRTLAQRSVDLPVGVSLAARDNLVAGVRGLASTLSRPASLERELHRYERRGAGARNRFRAQVRRARGDVEREVRERRSHVGRLVTDAQRRIPSPF